MSSTLPKLILFIPQLFQPLKLWNRDFGFTPLTPVFSSLFQTINSQKTSNIGFERSLFSTLGLPVNHELPIARYRYQGNLHQNKDTLICADPVHCEVGLNDVTLTHSINDLTTQESKELICQLNEHFSDDGFTFLLDENNRWYVALSDKEIFHSSPLDDVRGNNIFTYLPKSEKRNWEKIHNEVQMLLHVSSLNQSREIAGLPTVNSLWFWGGGDEISLSEIKFENIYGGNNFNPCIGTSFAKASNSRWMELPESGQKIIDSTLNNPPSENLETIVIFDQLINPSLNDNINEWQQQVSIIEENYISPLMDSWLNDQINIEIDTCNGQRITPETTSLWNTWYKKIIKQPPKPLNDIQL